MFLHAPGCNGTFGSSDVSDELLSAAKLLHFGYPPLMERMYADDGAELEDLFKRAKAQGCTTSLDMSLPDANAASGRADWRAILTKVLPYVDIFLPSVEEALFMLERQTFDALQGSRLSHLPDSMFRRLANEALELGAKMIGIKAGSRGIYLKTRDAIEDFGRATPSNFELWKGRELWAPCYRVNVQGTTGAGDATIAGLLMGLLKEMEPPQALTAAVAAGASCCEQSDAVSGVRSWPDTAQRISEGWPSLDPELDSSWNLRAGIYVKS
jgi:sugar/nucleoside kinase (ribokinase family)